MLVEVLVVDSVVVVVVVVLVVVGTRELLCKKYMGP